MNKRPGGMIKNSIVKIIYSLYVCIRSIIYMTLHNTKPIKKRYSINKKTIFNKLNLKERN